MKWTIHNTLVCPHSGVAFSSISSLRFLKFILWYEADILLLPGESIKLYSSSVLINEQYHAEKFITSRDTMKRSGRSCGSGLPVLIILPPRRQTPAVTRRSVP